MSVRLSEIEPLEVKWELVDGRLTAIERRLDRLEAREPVAAGRAAGAPDQAVPRVAAHPPGGMPDVGSLVALLGRTLLVLAGAFLLRALTESGPLDAGLGVLLGLAFAASWIAMADRAGGHARSASATFHGLAFVLIAFPLLFEATTRYHFLGAAPAAVALSACTALALAVSWRRRLHGLAWVATMGGMATATALVVSTAQLGPFALFLVLLGVATLWLGYVLDWTLLRWPAALLADLAILILSLRAVAGAADTPAIGFGAQILLLVAYLGSFAARTLVLNRDVIPFEVAQSIGVAGAGLGGAVYLTRMVGSGGLPLGAAILLLAASCYAAAAVFVERRESRRRNYLFYTSAGLVLAVVGGAIEVSPASVGPVYAVFGVIAAWAGRLSRRVTYRAHAAVYLTAAVVTTGLLPHVLYGLGLPFVPEGRPSVAMLAVLVLCGAAMWGLGLEAAANAHSDERRLPRLLVLVLLLGGVLGVTVGWILPPSSPGAPSPGLVATVRTALLVAAILTLALADRFWSVVEGAWLVYPLLLLTGLKFLLEDFRAGQPATLFVGFALYGLALIAGPRLRRRQGSRWLS
ncbi:MAG TPA: hypothetical protein VFK57_02090 [Vicinamibacterales bacterium]|nr:hypothetical protein [Vicinamibacterales bacterium]